MNMDVKIIVLVVSILLATIIFYFQVKDKDEKAVLEDIKKEVSYLFLYAQKQDWVNEKKMEWVVDSIYRLYPAIGFLIKEKTIEEFVEKLYTDFTVYAKNLVKDDLGGRNE